MSSAGQSIYFLYVLLYNSFSPAACTVHSCRTVFPMRTFSYLIETRYIIACLKLLKKKTTVPISTLHLHLHFLKLNQFMCERLGEFSKLFFYTVACLSPIYLKPWASNKAEGNLTNRCLNNIKKTPCGIFILNSCEIL